MKIIPYDKMTQFLSYIKHYMDIHSSPDIYWGIEEIDNLSLSFKKSELAYKSDITASIIIEDEQTPIKISFFFNAGTGEFGADETDFIQMLKDKTSSGKSLNGSTKIFIDIFTSENDDNPTSIDITAKIHQTSTILSNLKHISDIFSENKIHKEAFSKESFAELRISNPEEKFDYALIRLDKETWKFI